MLQQIKAPLFDVQTSLRQRYGRGAGVQARVTAVISVDAGSIDGEIERERTLQRLRREGRRFGPETWVVLEDPHHIALIAAEFGDALREWSTSCARSRRTA